MLTEKIGSERALARSTDKRFRRQSNPPKTANQQQERDLPERPYMVLKKFRPYD
jgi:hypothetical protein